MTEKITKKEMFNRITTLCANDNSIVEFCNHEIELLNKKNSTKVNTANDGLKEIILNTLASNPVYHTITEWQDLTSELNNFSNQKLSAVFNQLTNDGLIVKTIEKRKSFFKIA